VTTHNDLNSSFRHDLHSFDQVHFYVYERLLKRVERAFIN